MKLKITSPFFFNIKFYYILNNTFIIFEFFKSRFFFKLSQNIKLIKKQKKIFFVAKKIALVTLFSLKALYLKISFFFKSSRLFYKKLFLKGLGFKIISFSQNLFIELKIGYSHFVKIFIPSKNQLTLHINKSMIIIEGPFKDKVGNFANRIKSFRIPDSYKGKGI